MTYTSQTSTTASLTLREAIHLRWTRRTRGDRLRRHEPAAPTAARARVVNVPMRRNRPCLQVNGYMYPLFGVERALRKFPAYTATDGHQVPAVDCRRWFANPNQAALRQTLVKFRRRTFLLIFYHDNHVCVNASISGFVDVGLGNGLSCPAWRGEIAVFELGRHVFFLGRPGAKDILRKVLRLFLSRANEARLLGKDVPRELELLLA